MKLQKAFGVKIVNGKQEKIDTNQITGKRLGRLGVGKDGEGKRVETVREG